MKFAVSMLAVVSVASAAASFKSGSVSSYEKFTYGKFVTRMKAPDRKGTVSSFFTYWDGPGFYAGGWNELDIEVVPTMTKNPLSMNVIYGDGKDKNEYHDYAHAFNPLDDWHTYEFEWTPDYVSFSIDGNEVRHLAGDAVEAIKYMDKKQTLRMNFWTPTFESWGKGFKAEDMPWYVLYDYVEVFTYNEHLNEFEFHWRDDFESFDADRWHKASGGFEENSSVFDPSQVFTSHGNLILKMEPLDAKPESHLNPHGHHDSARVKDVDGHLHGPPHHEFGANAVELPHIASEPKVTHHQAVPVRHDPATAKHQKLHLSVKSEEHAAAKVDDKIVKKVTPLKPKTTKKEEPKKSEKQLEKAEKS